MRYDTLGVLRIQSKRTGGVVRRERALGKESCMEDGVCCRAAASASPTPLSFRSREGEEDY